MGLTATKFGTYFRTNLVKWKKVIREINIRAD